MVPARQEVKVESGKGQGEQTARHTRDAGTVPASDNQRCLSTYTAGHGTRDTKHTLKVGHRGQWVRVRRAAKQIVWERQRA